jgi:hypothetical protein
LYFLHFFTAVREVGVTSMLSIGGGSRAAVIVGSGSNITVIGGGCCAAVLAVIVQIITPVEKEKA